MMTYNYDSSTYIELSIPLVSQTLNIGDRLKEERVRLGYSQADFGELAGITKTTQFNYEKGSRSPDAAYLAAIASVGADVLYVLTGQRTPQAEAALSVREQTVLYTFRELSEEDQKSVQRLSAALKQSPHTDENGHEGNGAG
jgi:transcriptional regulator with XRE-family HTH domain